MRCARSSSARRLRPLVLLVLLVLLATGCSATLDIDIAVDRDGRGTLAVAVGADAALLLDAAGAGIDPLGDLAALGEELSAQGWQVSDERDAEGGRRVALRAPFASPAEFDALAGELTAALAAPELTPLRELRLRVTDDEVRFSGEAGLVPTDEVTTLGVQPDQAVAILADTEAVRFAVTVALPGETLASSAPDAAEAGPMTWRIAPGERVELLAVSERPRASWVVLAVFGGLGGLAAVALLGLARRRVSGGARPRRARGSAGSGAAPTVTGGDGEASSR